MAKYAGVSTWQVRQLWAASDLKPHRLKIFTALWYRIVRHISSQQAATLQLSVPIIVLLAGVRILNEPISQYLLMISAVVLGGVTLALLPCYATTGR